MSTWSERRIEAQVEQALVDGAKDLGGFSLKIAPVSYVGLPDRLVLLPGGLVAFVEAKSPGQEPSPRQRWWLAKLTALGFIARWVDSVEAAQALLQELAARNKERGSHD